MGAELAHEALKSINPLQWIEGQAGVMPADPRVAVSMLESRFYLRNQLLRDSDWASMAHSVELRTPLVDAWLLRSLAPMASALRRFPNKTLLAESPNDALPTEIVNRRKTGFGIPVNQWVGSHAGSSHLVPLMGSACSRLCHMMRLLGDPRDARHTVGGV
jgi:asparagine synthase (glutamine-hydrolysing)